MWSADIGVATTAKRKISPPRRLAADARSVVNLYMRVSPRACFRFYLIGVSMLMSAASVDGLILEN